MCIIFFTKVNQHPNICNSHFPSTPVERFDQTHNFYEYKKVRYVNNSTNVIIVCPKHGDFKQRPNDHLRGKGCNDCGRLRTSEKQRKTQENQ